MGSNSSALHATYAVSPSVSMPVAATPSVDHLEQGSAAVKLAQIIALGGWDPDAPFDPPVVDLDPEDVVGKYEAFCEAIQEATQHIDALQEAEAELAGGVADLHSELVLTTKSYLGGLNSEELQEIAAAKGFEHAELAGSDLYGQHPLVHWLDPAFNEDLPSKAMIQKKALERYEAELGTQAAQLAATSTQGIHTGAPSETGTWEATPEEMVAACADAINLANTLKDLAAKGEETEELLGDLIALENKVATASCPDPHADKMKAAVRGQVSQALSGSQLLGWDKLAKAELAAGSLNKDEAYLLSPAETVALLRKSTPWDERALLKGTADTRGAQIESMFEALDTVCNLKEGPGASLKMSVQGDELEAFAEALSIYEGARTAVLSWKDAIPDMAPMAPKSADEVVGQEFEAWVKAQKLAHLRKAAQMMGLTDSAKATRADIKGWVAAAWNPAYDKGEIQSQVTVKASWIPLYGDGHSASPPEHNQSPASATTKSPASAAKAVGGGFVAKHRDLVAALKQAKATAADLPVWHDAAEVSSWKLGPGAAAHLGGMHSKTLHTAPDGSTWMFKPDNQNHGARAHAEAAASAAFHAAGVPSVPVYVKQIGSKNGSLQPLIKNAHQLPDSPSSWSQSDVDAIVRFHVASWMVGDHDGKSDNVLRTPSGGLVPIDQGQAFKFYGSDKLAIDYHPNASCGAERPVFQQAYQAHLAGKLGKGVSVNPAAAHPVIKAFEAVPDKQWRTMLSSTAYEGAKHGVAWEPTMRKRAASKLGISESKVTTAQVAEAFLDHAVERKQGLRAAFTELFTGPLHLPTGAALKDGK